MSFRSLAPAQGLHYRVLGPRHGTCSHARQFSSSVPKAGPKDWLKLAMVSSKNKLELKRAE